MAKMNIKAVMINKGERYALYAAGGIMLLLMIVGIMNLAGTPSADDLVKELDSQTNRINSEVNGAAGGADQLPEWALKGIKIDLVHFPGVSNLFFDPISPPDKRRVNPVVLAANEIQADFAHAKIWSFDIDGDRIGVMVRQSKKGEASKEERTKFYDELRKRGIVGKKKPAPKNDGGGMLGGPGGMLGGPPGGATGRPGGMLGGPPGGATGRPGGMLGGPGGMLGGPPGGATGRPGGMLGGPPGFPGGGMAGFMGSSMASPRPGSSGFSPGNFTPIESGERLGIEYVPIKELEKLEGKRLALTIYPQRMVVVQAAFPYKAQILEIQKALRLQNPDMVLTTPDASPLFRSYSVQRRVVPAGQTPSPEEIEKSWVLLDLQGNYRSTIYPRKVGDQPEAPGLQYVMLPPQHQLTMPMPLLLSGKYPENHLASILATIKNLQALDKPPVQARTDNPLKGEGDIFQPAGTSPIIGQGQPNVGGNEGLNFPKGGRTFGPPKDDMGENGDVLVAELPETCLVRFIDNDITPGYQYQYRIKMKLQNPNWAGKFDEKTKKYEKSEKLELVSRPGDAKDEIIEGSWGAASGVVSVPAEEFLFATDPIAPDPTTKKGGVTLKPGQGLLQVQKWLPFATVGNFKEPVADWVVADILVQRGRYLGGKQFVNLPLWSSEFNRYILRELPAEKLVKGREPRRGVMMDPTKPGLTYVVVDVEGGKHEARIANRRIEEDSAFEVLLLGEDGSLQVRGSAADRTDKEREKREAEWRQWVERTEKATQSVVPGITPAGKNDFEK